MTSVSFEALNPLKHSGRDRVSGSRHSPSVGFVRVAHVAAAKYLSAVYSFIFESERAGVGDAAEGPGGAGSGQRPCLLSAEGGVRGGVRCAGTAFL